MVSAASPLPLAESIVRSTWFWAALVVLTRAVSCVLHSALPSGEQTPTMPGSPASVEFFPAQSEWLPSLHACESPPAICFHRCFADIPDLDLLGPRFHNHCFFAGSVDICHQGCCILHGQDWEGQSTGSFLSVKESVSVSKALTLSA